MVRPHHYLVLLLILGVSVVGCGGTNPHAGKATVTGKVTVGGKLPASGATIYFTGDGKESSSMVDRDGTYTITDAPVADCKIAVKGTTATPVVGVGGAMPGMAGGGETAPIPKKYETPGVVPNFTVKAGKNTHNIDLQP